MKKKLLCAILSVIIAASMTGCGPLASVMTNLVTTEATTEEITTEVEVTTEEATEKVTEEVTEATTEAKTPSTDTKITDAIDGASTIETDAAPLNQWVKVSNYATEDRTYHTVYVRVTKVTSQTEDDAYVQSAIKQHNDSSYDFSQIDVSELKIPSDCELCILDYEVYVPSDFPTPEYGITSPEISFSADNIGGGGIPSADGASVYIGMGMMSDLNTEKDAKYTVGNTYTMRGMFVMVKGYTDYVLEYTSYPEGTKEVSSDVMYHVYHKPF